MLAIESLLAGQNLLILAVLVALAAAIGFFFDRLRRGAAYQRRSEIIEQAQREAENIRKSEELAAKEVLLKRREGLEIEINKVRDKLREHEKVLTKREAVLDDQQQDFGKKERMLEVTQANLAERTKAVESRDKELNRVLKEEQEQLYKISNLDKESAKKLLLDRLDSQLKNETGALILKHEAELKQNCEKAACEIIGMAIQRCASKHTSEMTVSTVDIPNDEIKGRIIGREGRNIRAFEKVTGVDVIVDDTPGVVIVSAFDKVRREIARLSLTKLIQDGRIHPTRIEEVVTETQTEMDQHIHRIGQEACQEVGVINLNVKLADMMGRLNFRTSYSQNVLRHSIEVADLTAMLAAQFDLDVQLARRCGYLHDIGKAADHEMEGGHPAIGAELLKRYGETPEVVHAAAGHHDDIRTDYIYTVLVASADAVSASRPGARRETLDRYIKRLEELETLACGFPGVELAYAVQAGREIRVMVDSGEINDREAAKMCKDIATAIEQSLTYPGEIKVSVLRETKAVEFAR